MDISILHQQVHAQFVALDALVAIVHHVLAAYPSIIYQVDHAFRVLIAVQHV